jgi:hypothetical protein
VWVAHAPALRQVAARHLLDLRRHWLSVYSSLPTALRPEPDQVWQLYASTRPVAMLASGTGFQAEFAAPAAEFDRALAHDLLRGPGEDETHDDILAQRLLLSEYARVRKSPGKAALPLPVASLREIQKGMPADSLLLAPGLGEAHGYTLVVSADSVTVREIGSSSDIQTAVRHLFDAVGNPSLPLADVNAAARALGLLLLPAGITPPRHLMVLADEQLAAIPYSLLFWPGRDQPLVDSTSVSIVTLTTPIDGPRTDAPPMPIRVLVASMADEHADTSLPSLYGAEQEPALIRKAMPQRDLDIVSDARLDRQTLVEAFARTGAWVHVAAHGIKRPGFEGYAGIWLHGSESGAGPDFVSWLDFSDRPLGARLVVLNACQLAQNADVVSSGTSSFAAALSAAGVDNVVAALWPVSDGAAALWVSTFYASTGDASDVEIADALRAAQLRLRESRMFRHPFYWASLVHLQRGFEAR